MATYPFSHDGLRSESSGSGDHVAIQFNAAGQATHYFFYGPTVDQIFADETAADDILWPLTDHQGSVRDLANYDVQTDCTSVTARGKNTRPVANVFGNLVFVHAGPSDFGRGTRSGRQTRVSAVESCLVGRARRARDANRADRSRSLSVVVIQKPTEPLTAFNIAGASGNFLARVDELVLQPLMVALRVIVGNELSNSVPQ